MEFGIRNINVKGISFNDCRVKIINYFDYIRDWNMDDLHKALKNNMRQNGIKELKEIEDDT